MTDIERLQHIIDDLRRLRNECEPKSNQNPRYPRYLNAVSGLLWIISDLQAEEAQGAERAKCGRRGCLLMVTIHVHQTLVRQDGWSW